METVILATALMIALFGLGFEIGIASWSIRRANRYRLKKSSVERISEQAINERRRVEERMNFLDNYASDISWLLKFLYNRYNKFVDLETEFQEGLKNVGEDTSVEEAKKRYDELKRALKLILITVKVAERKKELVDSIIDQIRQAREDIHAEDSDIEVSAV
jgi:hypothetical protein